MQDLDTESQIFHFEWTLRNEDVKFFYVIVRIFKKCIL